MLKSGLGCMEAFTE